MRKESYHFGVHHCLHSFLSIRVKHFCYETMFRNNFQNLKSVANYFEKTSINLPISVSSLK